MFSIRELSGNLEEMRTENPTHERCSERIFNRIRYKGCEKAAIVRRTVKVWDRETVTVPLGAEAGWEGVEVKESREAMKEVPRWFCSTHDPVRIHLREEKERASRNAERDKRKAAETAAELKSNENEIRAHELIAKLGAGSTVSWVQDGWKRRVIENISLTFAEVEALLARLSK